MVEILGIIASIVVLISFTQSKPSRIRIINTVGCVLFVIYGILINSISIWFLNGSCIFLQIYKLRKDRGDKK